MSHYKPYPAYKSSGVEWLGRVPEHWQVMAIKHIVATPITDGPHETPDFFDGGVPFVSAEAVSSGKIDFDKIRGFISKTDHERYSQKYLPKRGDIFMIKSGATTGVTAIVETDAEFNIWSPLAVIRCNEGSNPYFVLNFMRSRSFQEAVALSWSYGTQQNIGMGVIGDLSVTVPPAEEQQSISAHLDRETARIDALVEKKTRFIELLREKRQALITHAVTKGLDPTVKMKESGVEWLGEVPEHWEIKRLQFLCSSIKAGPFGSALTKEMYVPEGYRVYGQEQVIPGDFSVGDYYITPEYFSELAQYAVQPGDVLVSCVGTFGKIAVVPEGVEPGIINPRLIRIRVNQLVSPLYMTMLMRSSVVFEQFSLWSRGGTMDIINIGTLSGIVMSVPPASEQQAILAYVEYETGRIGLLASKTERSIELLRERRSALITAAVTGQIDLREAR